MLINKKLRPNPHEVKIISLVGMMGTGKSKFGETLSKNLTFRFYEIDDIIEENFQMPISSIFSKFGEKCFRDEEKETIKNIVSKILKNKENSVISTGGGSFDNLDTRKLLLSNSLVIWLNCPIDILVKRIGSSKKRPMLKDNVKENLKKISQKRELFYKKAHVSFDTSNGTFNELTEQVIKYIKKCLF